MKESDLYLPVKEWLEDKGWEIYSEVSGHYGIADIVGKQGAAYCVVEMKTSLTHDVIEQALRWYGHAHYIYIAIPRRKKRVPRYLQQLFREKGIGVIEVQGVKSSRRDYYTECYVPSRHRKAPYASWDLHEEQKTFAIAGSAGGAHWTPYKSTMRDVKDYLRRALHTFYRGKRVPDKNDGWRSLNEILDHCETHYARPKPSLSKSLREFEADWCEEKKIGRKTYFRHRKEEEES